jgi:FHA domain
VTETGLLIAQAVVVLLVYLLVWSIVRSSSRELREAADAPYHPPPAPMPETVSGFPESTFTPPPAVATVHAPPVMVDEPAPEIVEAAATPTDTASGARRERLGPALDLAANLHPRILVESSPGLAAGEEIELGSGISIGRGAQNGLSLEDAFVSHMHARIFRRGQYLYLEDLGSTNGTYVNDRRIDKEAQLRVRDEIRVGETVLRYEE